MRPRNEGSGLLMAFKRHSSNFFFFKQKTAYEIKECDWSSDVCSSDLSVSFCQASKVLTTEVDKSVAVNAHLNGVASKAVEIGRASCRERV